MTRRDRSGRWARAAYYVNRMVFTKVQATYDIGRALPLGHSSLWLRSAAGFSPQRPDEPFANFFFGGFGNNYLDHGEEKRYREVESFPGAEINEIGGRNFVRSTLEWTLPPWRFSRVGTPGAYVSWLRPAAVRERRSSPISTMPSIRRRAISAGGQVDLQVQRAFRARHDLFGRRRRSRWPTACRRQGSSWSSLRVLR